MKFTSYYSNIVKSQGVPHLSIRQHQRLMNILFLEASMHAINQLQCDGQSLANKNRNVFNIKQKLEQFTQNQAPESIMQSMVDGSQ